MPTNKANRSSVVLLLIGFIVLFIAIVQTTDPLPQDNAYHQFADKRPWLSLPNFFDIISNLPFAGIGVAGLILCLKDNPRLIIVSWSVFFTGLTLVCIGSSYYHWQPNNATLFWDRLPMTISFMALLAALLTENVWPRREQLLLPCALLLGLSSVVYWRVSHDLRFYAFVQFGTLLAIPLVVMVGKKRYTHRHYLLYGLLFYILAKLFELNDREIFRLTGQSLSGHTLKHLAAAAATYCVYRMLKQRSALV
ncbi:ceramidase domain-containing protein [Methylomarinum vadi]|uniref:ceramidase domain-containing protein n=1 Tax=Methylomarinum vadi TaxID=438855 RepID=UPI0004DF099D|nr:ceramidase domain-containing protein [Methylomarinum vadi]